jgi:homoaconitase/3-isopropylmalate dehydratase large subunit
LIGTDSHTPNGGGLGGLCIGVGGADVIIYLIMLNLILFKNHRALNLKNLFFYFRQLM